MLNLPSIIEKLSSGNSCMTALYVVTSHPYYPSRPFSVSEAPNLSDYSQHLSEPSIPSSIHQSFYVPLELIYSLLDQRLHDTSRSLVLDVLLSLPFYPLSSC